MTNAKNFSDTKNSRNAVDVAIATTETILRRLQDIKDTNLSVTFQDAKKISDSLIEVNVDIVQIVCATECKVKEDFRNCLCVCGHPRSDHNYYGTGHCFFACPDENGKPREIPNVCQRFRPVNRTPTKGGERPITKETVEFLRQFGAPRDLIDFAERARDDLTKR